ncbi:MAG TPA: GNAT family N-acetyltransferase [Kribbella sp.]
MIPLPRHTRIAVADSVYRWRIENRIRHRNDLESSVETWTTAQHCQRPRQTSTKMKTRGAFTVNLSIRPARPDDVETLRTLIATMGYQVGSRELHTRLRALPDGHAVYVAESGSDGVGWIHVLISHSLIVGPRAEIAGLAVAPHAQGLGAGSALLSAVEKWTAQRGVRTIYLRSGTERKEAHAFYLSRGYEAVKTHLALTKSIAPTGEA